MRGKIFQIASLFAIFIFVVGSQVCFAEETITFDFSSSVPEEPIWIIDASGYLGINFDDGTLNIDGGTLRDSNFRSDSIQGPNLKHNIDIVEVSADIRIEEPFTQESGANMTLSIDRHYEDGTVTRFLVSMGQPDVYGEDAFSAEIIEDFYGTFTQIVSDVYNGFDIIRGQFYRVTIRTDSSNIEMWVEDPETGQTAKILDTTYVKVGLINSLTEIQGADGYFDTENDPPLFYGKADNWEIRYRLFPLDIAGCSPGVRDQLLDEQLLSDGIEECADTAQTHGDFVSCTSKLCNDFKKAGKISGSEKGAIMECAAGAAIP